jgi:hypothetical protein
MIMTDAWHFCSTDYDLSFLLTIMYRIILMIIGVNLCSIHVLSFNRHLINGELPTDY